jgi:hypothetical protein
LEEWGKSYYQKTNVSAPLLPNYPRQQHQTSGHTLAKHEPEDCQVQTSVSSIIRKFERKRECKYSTDEILLGLMKRS